MHPIPVFVFHILIKIDMGQHFCEICSTYGCKMSLIRSNIHHQWKKLFHSPGASNMVKLICGLKKSSKRGLFILVLERYIAVAFCLSSSAMIDPGNPLISPWRQAFFQPAGLAIIEVPSPPRVQHVLMQGAEQNRGHSSQFVLKISDLAESGFKCTFEHAGPQNP